MSDIVIGDVVQLKSGGPYMTVTEIDSDSDAHCVWFINDEQQHQNYFNVAALKKVPLEQIP